MIELVISLAISVLALTIASQLLYVAQRQSVNATREAMDPTVEIMLKSLRSDLYSASTASPGIPPDYRDGWYHGVLSLRGGDQKLEYEPDGNRLFRRVLDSPPHERPVLHNLAEWRWKVVHGVRKDGLAGGERPLVVIELAYTRTRWTSATMAATFDERRQTIAVALRGGGGGRW